ncbi:BNR repeat-like domain-containing protein [Arachidicoccus rhizosphaerae]|uniref:exo-alpha-sialidase n=1 Tax=Arachidicoccus rhizosphaerae TaxID=551991 RepID=A0A1H3W6M6_9BACT|nr:sialidase family protein [Arachidicoccus rhizosphaerae]SDZ82074.1 BNR repeat-like domain-containing protein [Arachidicoccus rhizosphaerae]
MATEITLQPGDKIVVDQWDADFPVKETPSSNDTILGYDSQSGSPISIRLETLQANSATNILGVAHPTDSPTGTEANGQGYDVSNTSGAEQTFTNFLDSNGDPIALPDGKSGVIRKSGGSWEFVPNANSTKIVNSLDSTDSEAALGADQGPLLTRKNEDFTPQVNLDVKSSHKGYDIVSLAPDDLTVSGSAIKFATGEIVSQADSSALDFYELPVNWDSIDWYQQASAFYGLALYDLSKVFISPAATDGTVGMKSVTKTQYPNAVYVRFSFNKTAADSYNFKLNIKTRVDLSKNYYMVQDMFDNNTYDKTKVAGKLRKMVYSSEVLSQNGKTVTSSGAIAANALFSCSVFLNISGFDTIRAMIPYSSFTGIALYDASLTLLKYVTGDSNLRKRTFTEVKATDYPTAVYAVMSEVTSRKNDFECHIYYPVVSYQDGINTEDAIHRANGYAVARIGYTTEQFSLAGFYKIDGTLNTSFPNYRSTPIIALPSGWSKIKYSTFPSSSSGVIFWDANMNVIGMASMPSNVNYMESFISRESFPTAKYYGYSWNDTFPPLNFRILSIGDTGASSSGSLTSGQETRIANSKMDSLATFNTANPSTPISSEIVFAADDIPGKSYIRIPTAILTNNSTLLVAAEYRTDAQGGGDLGEFDVFIKRKVSGGSGYDVIPVFPYDSSTYGRAMNPSFVVDRTGAHGVVGRIYMHVMTILDPTKTANVSPKAESDHLYIYSDDDGVTWSSPVSLKSKWAASGYNLIGVAPNNGIQTDDGTFYLPCMAAIGSGNWEAGLLYKTPTGDWTYSGLTPRTGDSECVVTEFNGDILLSCRFDGGSYLHSVYKFNISTNSFVSHSTDRTFNGYLPCKFDIERITVNGKTIYLKAFCDKSDVNAPDPNNSRYNLTLWASTDMLKWVRVYVIDLNRGYGYAELTCYNNKLIVAYETIVSTKLVIGMQDLSPLLTDKIYNAVTYQINRTSMELVNELIYRKNFNSY